MTNTDLFAELSDLAEDMPFVEFNETVASLYRFDVGVPDGISETDFKALVLAANPNDRSARFQIQEEIDAFAAYLRCVRRNRVTFGHLIRKLS